jgi:hypothetical protein
MEARLPNRVWPESATKITADAIELELGRPFGSLIFWKQTKLKLPATQGPSQLQFNCVSCHFCGPLGQGLVRRKSHLSPSVISTFLVENLRLALC